MRAKPSGATPRTPELGWHCAPRCCQSAEGSEWMSQGHPPPPACAHRSSQGGLPARRRRPQLLPPRHVARHSTCRWPRSCAARNSLMATTAASSAPRGPAHRPRRRETRASPRQAPHCTRVVATRSCTPRRACQARPQAKVAVATRRRAAVCWVEAAHVWPRAGTMRATPRVGLAAPSGSMQRTHGGHE